MQNLPTTKEGKRKLHAYRGVVEGDETIPSAGNYQKQRKEQPPFDCASGESLDITPGSSPRFRETKRNRESGGGTSLSDGEGQFGA